MFGIGDEFDKLRKSNSNTLFKYIYEGRTISENAEQFFFPIYGLREIKENIYRSLTDSKQKNVLLSGPRSPTKDIFLLKIYELCNDVIYYQPALEKSPRLADEIYTNKNVKVIIIDNINKLRKSDWAILPDLLNDGIIEKTIKKNKIEIKIDKIKIFVALDEDQNRLGVDGSLSKLRAVFLEYYIPEYSDEEFAKCVKFYCRNKLPNDKIEIIANELIKHKVKDITELIHISSLLFESDTKEEIVDVVRARIKYRPRNDNDV